MSSTSSRHDGDSWDLASSVGATATAVAASRAAASQGPDALLNDPWAEPLVHAVGIDAFVRMVDGELPGEDDPLLNRRAMNEQMAVRTRFFDDFFTAASQSGIRQAVILASGLDARAYRLDWPADMTVFEIDQPDVIEFKATTLAGLGAEPKVDLRTVPIDLREDWPTALTAAGFDPGRPSAWIAEGLYGYLPPEAQDRLLDAITELAAPGSRLGSEAVPSIGDLDMEAAQERMRESTAKWRELGFDLDFSELTFNGERHDVGEYLDARGWTSTGTPMADLLAKNDLPAIPETDDEQPTMNGVTYFTSIFG